MIRRLVVSAALVLALAAPAAAHKLKVFAAVQGNAVTGYAFFIGGGRAQGTSWVAKDAQGAVLAEGETDDEGRFRFVRPASVTSAITVTVDTHDGHIASATLVASRFGAIAGAAAAPATSVASEANEPVGMPTSDAASGVPSSGLSKEAATALVEAAVQRQVKPLLERIEQMDDRLRFTDILSGVFLIIGLAGIGLWVRARTR